MEIALLIATPNKGAIKEGKNREVTAISVR